MRRTIWLLALLAACGKKDGLESLDQGLEFAKTKGLVIESSSDVPTTGGAIVKGKQCTVRGHKATLTVYEFVSAAAQQSWAEKSRNEKLTLIPNGKVLFVIEGQTAGDRQAIAVILK